MAIGALDAYDLLEWVLEEAVERSDVTNEAEAARDRVTSKTPRPPSPAALALASAQGGSESW